jgi:glycosyltransferase involved in cell wall biosynthesis
MIETSLPLVSVVMPVHNGALYLSDAIKSILSQTYPHFELIIINDGSSDNSEYIINAFNDSRIKYNVFNKQQGIVAALNFGLTLAKGDFIARMDADDIMHPQKLEKQIEILASKQEFSQIPKSIGSASDLMEKNVSKVKDAITKEEFYIKKLNYENEFNFEKCY